MWRPSRCRLQTSQFTSGLHAIISHIRHRLALYADYVVIFIAPAEQEILIVKEALGMFA
jgi:hypothetical protein